MTVPYPDIVTEDYVEYSSGAYTLVAHTGAAATKNITGLDAVPCQGFTHGELVVKCVDDDDLDVADGFFSSIAALDDSSNYNYHVLPLAVHAPGDGGTGTSAVDCVRFIMSPARLKLRCRAWHHSGNANALPADTFTLRLFKGPVPERWTVQQSFRELRGRSITVDAGAGGLSMHDGQVTIGYAGDNTSTTNSCAIHFAGYQNLGVCNGGDDKTVVLKTADIDSPWGSGGNTPKQGYTNTNIAGSHAVYVKANYNSGTTEDFTLSTFTCPNFEKA